MFAYIAGSPFVVETLYGQSPQVFSLIFGTNALGIVLAGQLSATLVERARTATARGGRTPRVGGRGGPPSGRRRSPASASSASCPAFFLVTASIGLILPNATALALTDHGQRAGSALAIMGALQYVVGALVAPLVGIAGTGTALPMAIVIAVLSLGALLSYLALARPRSGVPTVA